MNSKRLRLVSAGLAALIVALGVVLGFGTRYTTAYGTATSENQLAAPVQQMRLTQRQLATDLARLLQVKNPQVSTDPQSALAESVFSQYATGACQLGQARYLDTFTLANIPTAASARYDNPEALLRALAAATSLKGVRATGDQLLISGARFRVQVNVISGDTTDSYQFQIPVLQYPQDTTSAACYPTSQLPLSAVRNLR